MGCGCSKKRGVNGEILTPAKAGRRAVYQVIKDGQVLSEHLGSQEARRVAKESGGRLRITSQPIPT